MALAVSQTAVGGCLNRSSNNDFCWKIKKVCWKDTWQMGQSRDFLEDSGGDELKSPPIKLNERETRICHRLTANKKTNNGS
ncbi:hypothetical protein VNO77_44415 [Canavalia gladiata]|uniref:Uncharacterized protein n=1 Tax=Canavalia gladiata TaxID=3824 RepID=A0AAN9JYY0_CANGL